MIRMPKMIFLSTLFIIVKKVGSISPWVIWMEFNVSGRWFWLLLQTNGHQSRCRDLFGFFSHCRRLLTTNCWVDPGWPVSLSDGMVVCLRNGQSRSTRAIISLTLKLGVNHIVLSSLVESSLILNKNKDNIRSCMGNGVTSWSCYSINQVSHRHIDFCTIPT